MDEKALLAKAMLNLKLIKLAWALFLILIGASWILENFRRISSEAMWALIYAGSGAILILLNLLRFTCKIKVSRFTVWLGVLGVFLGAGNYYSSGSIPIWAAVILVIGLSMLLGVLKK